MPTDRFYTQVPALYQPRQKIKEWLIEKYPFCELTGLRGTDLHEGLIAGNDLKGLDRKPFEIKVNVWKTVLHSPINLFLLDHDIHINGKPSKSEFLRIALSRPAWFFQDWPLENWTFPDAEMAWGHFQLMFEVFHEQKIFKNRINLPVL